MPKESGRRAASTEQCRKKQDFSKFDFVCPSKKTASNYDIIKSKPHKTRQYRGEVKISEANINNNESQSHHELMEVKVNKKPVRSRPTRRSRSHGKSHRKSSKSVCPIHGAHKRQEPRRRSRRHEPSSSSSSARSSSSVSSFGSAGAHVQINNKVLRKLRAKARQLRLAANAEGDVGEYSRTVKKDKNGNNWVYETRVYRKSPKRGKGRKRK
ncbi:hypothetical protein AAHC03_09259 [Spirometra sp. Aus1]